MTLRRIPFALLTIAAAAFASDFPTPHNTEKGDPEPIAPQEALATLKLPPGFSATLFAHEPEVQNPIAMTWDSRGRMWVAENYTYAEKSVRFETKLRDRVLIFEDRDGDGRAESRKVFTDTVQMLTSVEVGHGGVWLMCPPQLLFVPDRNGDDVPDGPAEVVLDGFEAPRDNYHNFANGLRWGPDGWLYGRCGASAPGELGAPGTPASKRVPMRGGIWRYHPQRKVVEALTHGTTNPWGHDWDAHGELFFINTVNGHLWHAITGAHLVRPHTISPNPHAFTAIDQHADHWHFDTGKGWMASRDGVANDYGGGHAHSGMMIYQGSQWPEKYRGRLFTLNFHGRRANVERLERAGSGFVGRHEPDAFFWEDPWFRGVEIRMGPVDAAYVLDWSDTGECHENTGVHRTSGRIYRIEYGDAQAEVAPEPRGAAPSTAADLVKEIRAGSAWRARSAQLQLTEAAARGEKLQSAHEALRSLFENGGDPALQLRALWALHGTGGASRDWLRQQLQHPNEHIRTWAIRLLTDEWPLDSVLGPLPHARHIDDAEVRAELARLAQNDPSGLVRLTLASTLQRMPVEHRAELAAALVRRAEDAADHNLPAMVWFGLIPVGEKDLPALVRVAAVTTWLDTLRFISRRVALAADKQPQHFNDLLAHAATQPPAFQASVLQGAAEAFKGWRKAPKPAAWDALAAASESADTAMQALVRDLSTLFGDGRALEEVKRVALDKTADFPSRDAALRTLIESRPADLRQICESLLEVRHLNTTAVRGLTLFDDPALGARLAKEYRRFWPPERSAVIEALVSRPAWARALLDQIRGGTIPRSDLTPLHARQIRSLGEPALDRLLTEVWGELRESPEEKRRLIAKWKSQLKPDFLAMADLSKGRAVYTQACSACHKLYGEGGDLGPDLTGSGRDNLDYLLDNIIDPSAVVTADFRMSVVKLKDGRVLNGLLSEQTDRTVTVRTPAEALTIERAEIEAMETSAASQMPEGLLEALTNEQVRDLIAYLQSPVQAPLPGGK